MLRRIARYSRSMPASDSRYPSPGLAIAHHLRFMAISRSTRAGFPANNSAGGDHSK